MKNFIKKSFSILFALVIVLTSQGVFAMKSNAAADPDSWSAIDGLGRPLTMDNSAGKEEKERYVGMFYWTWHSDFYSSTKTSNVQKIIEEYPDAKNNFNHKAWGGQTGYMFWNEPIYGYYGGTDKWVMRKQAELLADAGVDFVVFDCTNGTFTWKSGYTAVCQAFLSAKEDGVNVPKIVFMLNFGAGSDTNTMLGELYRNLYGKDKFKDLWFYYEDKPLIIAHTNENTNQKYLDFFTFRKNVASYFSKDTTGKNEWGWLSTYPQAVYYTKDGKPEETSVGVAQNANYKTNKITAMSGNNVMGRSYVKGDYTYSYTYKNQQITVSPSIENSKLYGLNFQQQWDFAISIDPTFVFVTGWNEWVAIRSETWAGDTTIKNTMVDEFTDEYSRDIEPSTGDLKDHYYYQLVENIRRYKGTKANGSLAVSKTIEMNGDQSQWSDVPAYESYKTVELAERNGKGYGKTTYTNTTLRNDITLSKVAYDNDNIYFYVETREEMSSESESAFMRLLINTDNTDVSNNWESFEYIINRENPADGKGTLEKSIGGWNWGKVCDVTYTKSGNCMTIAVPRDALGVKYNGCPALTFKWSDNMQEDGNILDFYNNGDVAPGGRFTFVVGDFTESHTQIEETESPSVTPAPSKSGCGSIVSLSSISMLAALTVMIFKKKKN